MKNYDRIRNRYTWLKSRMTAIPICELLDEKDKTIAALETRITEMEARFDSITESTLRSAGEAVIKLETRVGKLEDKLSKLAPKLTDEYF